VTVERTRIALPKWFVLRILDLSSLKTGFCEVRCCDTRTGHGFRRHRKKKFCVEIRRFAKPANPSGLRQEILFRVRAKHPRINVEGNKQRTFHIAKQTPGRRKAYDGQSTMKAVAVIPARLASTRLPRKMLREIAGKPLVGWVYEAVRSSPLLSEVIIATDSEEIMEACRQHGWNARMTSPTHRSGTGRVHEVSNSTAAEVYVNVQGDEPLVRPQQIATLLDVMKDNAVQVGTIKTPCPKEEITNPNAVKVVTAPDGRALYFSRATIPFDRDKTEPRYFKHLGLYAYRKAALDLFVSQPESTLEKSERLEQLRFLENGIAIHVGETPYDSVGVDTEEDLQRAAEILRKR
jgi:3-deoxy-manno-octulosonate cytidylyltransferase (CMP-KDO synthetase)